MGVDDTVTAGRPRDAERSREAILDAAERLFADRGYEATSLQDVGRLAGLSRGTPGYFFGSKDRLYRAVLERAFAAELQVVGPAVDAGGPPEEVLAGLVGRFVDFLAERPTFVRLVGREALAGGDALRETGALTTAIGTGLSGLTDLLARDRLRAPDPARLLVSLVALCWFPFAHADTFLRELGLDPGSPEFVEGHKRHVVDLILRGIR